MKIFSDKIAKNAYQNGGVADARSGQTVATNDIGALRGKVKNSPAHCAPTKFGMGDYYGTGIKQPIGKMRDSSYPGMNPVSEKKLKVPPKSVV